MADSSQNRKFKGLIVYFVNDNFEDQKYNVSRDDSETESTAKELRAENDYEVQYYSNLTTDQIVKRITTVSQEDYGDEASLTIVIKSHIKESDSVMARDGWFDLSKVAENLNSDTSKWKGKETQLILDSYDKEKEDREGEKVKKLDDVVDGIATKLVFGGIKKVIKMTGGAALKQKIMGKKTKDKENKKE